MLEIKKTVIVVAISLTFGVTEAWSDNEIDPSVTGNFQSKLQAGDYRVFDGSNVRREDRDQRWGKNVLRPKGEGQNVLGREGRSQSALRSEAGSRNVLRGENVLGGGGNVLGKPTPARQVKNRMENATSGFEAIISGGKHLKEDTIKHSEMTASSRKAGPATVGPVLRVVSIPLQQT